MLRTRLAVQLLRLGAEIKGDDRRVDHHEVLADLALYGLPRKDRRQRQRHDRFDRQQIIAEYEAVESARALILTD